MNTSHNHLDRYQIWIPNVKQSAESSWIQQQNVWVSDYSSQNVLYQFIAHPHLPEAKQTRW